MNSKSAPPVPLVYPQPAGLFFLGVFANGKKPSGSACIDASRLIFQSAVSFQIRLVAKKQAGPTRLFACIPAVKPSEFTERTLRGRSRNSKYPGYPRFRLFTPNPPDYFFLGCSLTRKNPADPLASMLADWFFSRLYLFKSAWSQKKQAGPTRLFACIPAVKPSEGVLRL